MDYVKQSGEKQSSQALNSVAVNRRSANYKPNIWKYDFLQSLTSNYDAEEYVVQFEKLVDKVKDLFMKETSILTKLELIDSIQKLGLSNHFQKEIKQCQETIISIEKNNLDMYGTALSFKLLRQLGYFVSQSSFLADKNILEKSSVGSVKEIIELLDGSHLAFEGEIFLDEVRTFTTNSLKYASSNIHHNIEQVVHALELPSHWRVQWFDVKWHINQYQKQENVNPCLLDLAKLKFNVTQAILQKEVKELSRWWKNLELKKDLNFARDRLVESFMCAAGVASEPKYKSLRKWLTKIINLVLVIDDVYDIYASFEELKQFTVTVDRWDAKELLQLPDYMRVCFRALNDVVMETACEVEGQLNFNMVLSYIKKSWVDFCKALYQEAQWYKEGYIPSLHEYLSNAWISSSGPVILLHVFFATMHEQKNGVEDFLKTNQDLIYNVSLVIRLCNDLGTAVAERERGDSASSIVCYMNEMNVSEEAARKHIKEIIKNAWKKINERCFTQEASTQSFVSLTANAARVAHTLYQNGDGFGIQDRDIRLQILSLIIEPFSEV